MSKELHIRITVGEGFVHGALVGLLLAVFPVALGSETVTLQTYYPSPYGIYTQLRTTNKTTLAEAGGSVGIGTTSPGYKLHVSGGDAYVSGSLGAGTSISAGTSVSAGTSLSAGGSLSVAGGGSIIGSLGVGTASPSQKLHVTGNGQFDGYVSVIQSCTERPAPAPDPDPSPCTGYATFAPGIKVDGFWHQSRATLPEGYFFYTATKSQATNAITSQDWRLLSEVGVDQRVGKWYCCSD